MARFDPSGAEIWLRFVSVTPQQILCFVAAANIAMTSIALVTMREYRRPWFDSQFFPRSQRSAMESTAREKGFDFYFSVKAYYKDSTLVVPENSPIDDRLLDRLTFIKAAKGLYNASLTPQEEFYLYGEAASSKLYLPQVRHPSSILTGREASAFFLTTKESASKVYLMLGNQGFYFVPCGYFAQSSRLPCETASQ